ncbi:MAG: hypothetical protein IJ428_03320 [Clostridia bacterium]|nr:hypothetical protein [Clostridia bacterium]
MKKGKQLRYFKNLLVFQIISAVLVVIGFLLYRYSWELWAFGSPLIVIGLIGLVTCFVFKVSDQSYTEYFDLKFEAMPKERDISPDFTACEYSFEGNAYAKLDKSGSPRSELCMRTFIYFGKQLKVVRGTANAVSDTLDVQAVSFDTARAEIVDVECRVGGSLKKLAKMKLVGADGAEIEFPVKYNDIEVDKLAEQINSKYKA